LSVVCREIKKLQAALKRAQKNKQLKKKSHFDTLAKTAVCCTELTVEARHPRSLFSIVLD
jgi:hypothetical protein